jgi:hypothetical protein
MGTEEYLVDAQPELLQVETQSSKHKQLKSYASVISAGLLCIPISSAKHTCRPIFKFLELIYLQSSSR